MSEGERKRVQGDFQRQDVVSVDRDKTEYQLKEVSVDDWDEIQELLEPCQEG